MEINIKGAGKKQADRIHSAAYVYAALLMQKRLYNKLTIDIELVKDLEVCGFCEVTDDIYPPRIFKVFLRKNKMPDADDNPFRTLAHEMVHIKQYARGELQDRSALNKKGKLEENIFWMGEKWKKTKREYWLQYDSPWEIEAYGREIGLYLKWTQFDYEKRTGKL